MHLHRGTLRLLITLITLVVLGSAAYVLIVYAMSKATSGVPTPIQPSATTTISVATSSLVAATSSPITSTSTLSSESGMQVITPADNNTTVHLTKNERFVMQLGSGLTWTLSFDPAGSITRVPNSTTANGVQGVYEADVVGTTTLHATGAPICKAGQACPMFLEVSTITFVVK